MVHLLDTGARPSQNYDHEKKMIKLFWPKLVKRIDPAEFVGYLYSAKIIQLEDMQVINSKQNNAGQQAGAVMLLERIQIRQAPGVWYEMLLDLMMANSLGDLVKHMEPDFYDRKMKSGRWNLRSVARKPVL